MTRKIRTILDQVQDVLIKQDQNARDLWAILTALRGPDANLISDYKYKTTGVIRHQAFPKLYESNFGCVIGAVFNDLVPPHAAKVFAEDNKEKLGHHFTSHIENAVNALENK